MITIIIKDVENIQEAIQALTAQNPVQVEEKPLEVESPGEEDEAPVEKAEEVAVKGRGWHYKRRRTCHQWKIDEQEYVRDLFDKGVSYGGIAEALENKFGFKVSVASIKQRVRKSDV